MSNSNSSRWICPLNSSAKRVTSLAKTFHWSVGLRPPHKGSLRFKKLHITPCSIERTPDSWAYRTYQYFSWYDMSTFAKAGEVLKHCGISAEFSADGCHCLCHDLDHGQCGNAWAGCRRQHQVIDINTMYRLFSIGMLRNHRAQVAGPRWSTEDTAKRLCWKGLCGIALLD